MEPLLLVLWKAISTEKEKSSYHLKKNVYLCKSKMNYHSQHINVRICFLNIKKRDVYDCF